MRTWKNIGNEDKSVHCLGNGRMAAYGMGPDIIQVFGPPYSSASFVKLVVAEESLVETRSEREPGAAIWRHEILSGGKSIGRIVDFVDAEIPALVRRIEVSQAVRLHLEIDAGIETVVNGERFASLGASAGILAGSQRGARVFSHYPSPIRFWHQVALSGAIGLENREPGRTWTVACSPGASTLFIAGGPSYPQCIENTEMLLALPWTELLERTQSWWRAFAGHRADFARSLPAGAPERDLFLSTADDVATLIKAQQGIEGGILAGSVYHWAAFRDQFGALRCLLALGHREESKSILRYYGDIFSRRGALHNGQDIGLDGFFHIHENDEVEITGYLLVQAFDYLRKTRDEKLLREMLPMLEWAFDAQTRNIARHMLPFNGDETYIAGAVLPRSAINDGSAESTLLFITGGSRFLDWIEKRKLWPAKRLARARKAVSETRAHYRENFWSDGRLVTNNPARLSIGEMPRFRHGVCEAGYIRYGKASGLRCQGGAIGWVEKTETGRYLCPSCRADGIHLPQERERHYLSSVSLVPLYLGSDIFTKQEIASVVDDILDLYRKNGWLPSSPDGARTVGYDYGLLLYTLTELAHPMAEEIYRRMMSVLDSTGAWVEYYQNDAPIGCPCRPYESGINLEAAIHFLSSRAAPAGARRIR